MFRQVDYGKWGVVMFTLFGLSILFAKPWLFLLGMIKSNAFPKPLNEAEEAECLQRWQQGDMQARHKLIEHNLRLVAHVVKKFETNRVEQEDFISIGTIGLIKAIERYQPNVGTKLATFAAKCIENEILMHLRATKKNRNHLSLQEPFGTDREGNELTLLDVLGTDGEEVHEAVSIKMERAQIRAHLHVLNEREQFVIRGRFGLDTGGDEQTQKQIAKSMDISRSYVSRIEKRALMKLYQAVCKISNGTSSEDELDR